MSTIAITHGNTLARETRCRAPQRIFSICAPDFFNERYDIALFVRNVTDRREQTQAGVEAAGGFLRFQNEPRSYGVEVKASF